MCILIRGPNTTVSNYAKDKTNLSVHEIHWMAPFILKYNETI